MFQKVQQFHMQTLGTRYAALFHLSEVSGSQVLQYVFGSLILSYLVVFNDWNNTPHFAVNTVLEGAHLCWPYFQNCGEYAFLYAPPLGYSHTAWYGGLLALLLFGGWNLLRGEFRYAHVALVSAWLWHTVSALVFSLEGIGTFDYYLIILSGTFLFLPHKQFFLKVLIVLFYVLSTTTKMNEGWVLGTYFSSLSNGMPFFPDVLIPVLSNTVILMEMVGAWFLLGKRTNVHKVVFAFFLCFHLFSSVFVWYRFPIIVIPALFILFGPLYEYEQPPLDRRSIAGWLVVCCCVLLQSISIAIPGNAALTQEGLRYGMYMFDANHQCISHAVAHRLDGTSYTMDKMSASSRVRCDPYVFYSFLKRTCGPTIGRISWTLDHSINGEPFLRIVDEQDVCALRYAAFQRNTWIRTESDNPMEVGHPLENWYE